MKRSILISAIAISAFFISSCCGATADGQSATCPRSSECTEAKAHECCILAEESADKTCVLDNKQHVHEPGCQH